MSDSYPKTQDSKQSADAKLLDTPTNHQSDRNSKPKADALDKSLRLNPRGTESLVVYSYIAPDSLLFFQPSEIHATSTHHDNDNNNDIATDDHEQSHQKERPTVLTEDVAKTHHNISRFYPYIYTSTFIMQCLANQVAHAEPEPKIAIATCNPETLKEEELPFVTSESVVTSLEDESNKNNTDSKQNKDSKIEPASSDSLSQSNNTSTKNNIPSDAHIDQYDSLLRQSTPAGIDQSQDKLQMVQKVKKLSNNYKGSTLATKTKNKTEDVSTTTLKSGADNQSKTQYDELVKKQRPKDENEVQAEKESKLESYKQFVAKQKNKVDIDYPAIRVSIEANALPSRMYFIMNALSAVIASYGLVMNSAAVVIGAMLVAMMLGPISGTALAIIDYRIPLLRKSILTVIAGASMVLLIGYIIGSIHEGRPLTNEILSRTQPTSMDLMVALAGGTAGAYAMISPHLSVAVVGVAVATALVPPLAASGILFANGEMTLGFGALLLALTNIIAIQFTNGLVLWFAGFRRLMSEDYKSNTHLAFFRRNAVPLVLLTGIGIYLSYNLNTIATRQSFESNVTHIIEDYFVRQDNMLDATQFINKPKYLTIRAVITGQTRPNSSDVKFLEDKITSRMIESTPDMPEIQLQLRYIPVVVIESTPRTQATFDKTDAAILSNE